MCSMEKSNGLSWEKINGKVEKEMSAIIIADMASKCSAFYSNEPHHFTIVRWKNGLFYKR